MRGRSSLVSAAWPKRTALVRPDVMLLARARAIRIVTLPSVQRCSIEKSHNVARALRSSLLLVYVALQISEIHFEAILAGAGPAILE